MSIYNKGHGKYVEKYECRMMEDNQYFFFIRYDYVDVKNLIFFCTI